MAKKEKQKKEYSPEETQKRIEKYVKANEGEKKGKAAVISMIGFAVLCFAILLVIILRLTGVGKTIVFDTASTKSDGSINIYTTDTVQGTTVADYIADKVVDAAN